MDHDHHELRTGKAGGEANIEAEGFDEEDAFQQRINSIKAELEDTYNIFVNARETLSSISFEHLGESLSSENLQSTSETPETYETATQEITLPRDVNNRIDVAKSLERLNSLPTAKDADQYGKAVEQMPELNKFFKVISDLTEGIKKITSHQQSITELNDDINSMGEQLQQQQKQQQPSGAEAGTLSSQLGNMAID